MIKADISYDEFAKLDIRAGLIVEASAPDWSEKLIRYEIDLGEEVGKRILFSGIRKWYKPEDLVGKMVPVVVNLAPKKMGEEESAGMVIMTDGEDGAAMIFLSEKIKPGTIVR
ncbi:methionine--tRNA ligase [Candidatus Collierbacteria bacterium]|nr:methionine--tRNA ligase [Candidatus Collierbacteria bacterium]